MSIDRRSLLKAMALTAIALPRVVHGRRPNAAPADVSPSSMLALVPPGPVGKRFARGVSAAGGRAAVVIRVDTLTTDLLGSILKAREHASPRLLGLLDDAVAAPLLSLLRGTGVAMPWLAQHEVQPTGSIRHQVLAAIPSAAADCARRLSEESTAAGAGTSASGAWPGGRRELDWAMALGGMLAVTDRAPPPAMPGVRGGEGGVAGHFVSFLVDGGEGECGHG